LLDVAACCEALLNKTLLRKRLARLGGVAELTEQQVQRLCVPAAIDDLGKFNIGFQKKAWSGSRLRAGHVAEVLAEIGGHAFSSFGPPRGQYPWR
jgi:CRISPR-associated endonuclease/helicase Cas3